MPYNMMVIVDFRTAPEPIREIANQGGDEDHILIISKAVYDEDPGGGLRWCDTVADRLDGDGSSKWFDADLDGVPVKMRVTTHS